ncbi:MAG: hypothetical protein HWE34_14710 [Methylocystaceae bacterium]|nr:hypothetical protein [Methylocystaceae bacterium]
MGTAFNKVIRAIRADISALLLIAFIYQLLMPVAVLAGEETLNADFQADLRASICRVKFSQDNNIPDAPRHTDGFVCDLCLITTFLWADPASISPVVDMATYRRLPETTQYALSLRETHFAQILGNLSSSRAPPSL